MILISNRLKLNNINISKINDFIYYRVMKVNKNNKFYNEIRNAITEKFIKYRDITLNKYFI